MNRYKIISFIVLISLVNISYASSIRKCRQSDGTILFTNKPCAIATRSFTSLYNEKKYRKPAPFRQASFVRLQKTMIQAESADKMQQRARVIMDKALTIAKNGHINNAYDIVASSYAKLSERLKNRHWKGQIIESYSLRTQRLFEEVLISQSTTSTFVAMEIIVQAAWNNYSSNPNTPYYGNLKTSNSQTSLLMLKMIQEGPPLFLVYPAAPGLITI